MLRLGDNQCEEITQQDTFYIYPCHGDFHSLEFSVKAQFSGPSTKKMFPRRGSCQLSISYHFTVFSVVGQQCVKLTELCHRLTRVIIFFYFRYWCLFTSQNGGGKACSLPPTNPSDTTYGYVTHSNLCQDCVILINFIFSFGADGHIWSCLHPGASELCGLQQHNRQYI